MAVYTCFDMLRDCRSGQREGWQHLVRQYVPYWRALLVHYAPHLAMDPETDFRILGRLQQPGCHVFDAGGPVPEGQFLLDLRAFVLGVVLPPEPERRMPLAADRLAALSLVERQAVWLETLKFDDRLTGRILDIDPALVLALRKRARAALGGAVPSLFAVPPAGPACLSPRPLGDLLEGRASPSVEEHLMRCWCCLDLLCRLREARYLMARRPMLTDDEVRGFEHYLGVEEPRPTFWQRVRSAGWS
jgi:hypothetical protein